MDSFARSEWQEGMFGELFAGDEFRRFEYTSHGSGLSRAALLVKNEMDGWDVVMELVSRFEENERLVQTLSVGVIPESPGQGWGRERFYDRNGTRLSGMSKIFSGIRFDDIEAQMREMLFPVGECPEEIDMGLTIALFFDQMKRLNFSRPVLVPDGLFTYVEPEELYPGARAFTPNITNAAKLYVSAQTAEEKRVAAAINRYVIVQEVSSRFH